MNKKRIFQTIIFALILTFGAQAQLKKANKLFNYFNYAEAIPYYLKVIDSDDDDDGEQFEATQKLAHCYRYTNDVVEAQKWYERVLLYSKADTLNYFYLGQALRSMELYDDAANAFNTFMLQYGDSLDAENYHQFCIDIKEWQQFPDMAEIMNVSTLNTSFSEFGPSFYKEGVVFTSDRRIDVIDSKTYGWTDFSYLNLYYSKPEYTGNYWDAMSQPESMNQNFNQTFHDGPVTFSADESVVYVTKTVKRDGQREKGEPQTFLLKMFYAQIEDGKKLKFEPFFVNNKNYSVAHPSLTPDGSKLFFSSDMPGGYGGSDIYYCERGSDKWSEPINLGELVNTPGEEAFPFVVNDSVLFFSSAGHLGFGGLDIFKTNLVDSIWLEPINVMKPINSSYDDFGIILLENGKDGLFSSNRPGGKGSDDIYSFKNLRFNDFMISGFVKETGLNKPIFDATVFLLNTTTSDVKILKTDEKGYFETFAERDQTYMAKGMKSGYIYDCLSFITPAEKGVKHYYVYRDLLLTKLEIDQVFIFENIYYDLDKSYIREDAKEPLDNLVQLMKHYPITAEISSHTDSRAPFDYNMKLSQRRAESAVNYLVSQGIERDRLTAKGYGESMLLNHCSDSVKCTEAEHAKNRRTEFRITSIDAQLYADSDFKPGKFNAGEIIKVSTLNANFFDNCTDEEDPIEETEVVEVTESVVAIDSTFVIYRIQLEASDAIFNVKTRYSAIDDLISEYGIIVVLNHGIYNYQLGHFTTSEEANKVWEMVKEQGYKNSFVVSLRK